VSHYGEKLENFCVRLVFVVGNIARTNTMKAPSSIAGDDDAQRLTENQLESRDIVALLSFAGVYLRPATPLGDFELSPDDPKKEGKTYQRAIKNFFDVIVG
jgi:hypothetical protein